MAPRLQIVGVRGGTYQDDFAEFLGESDTTQLVQNWRMCGRLHDSIKHSHRLQNISWRLYHARHKKNASRAAAAMHRPKERTENAVPIQRKRKSDAVWHVETVEDPFAWDHLAQRNPLSMGDAFPQLDSSSVIAPHMLDIPQSLVPCGLDGCNYVQPGATLFHDTMALIGSEEVGAANPEPETPIAPATDVSETDTPQCTNCGTQSTPLWRRDSNALLLCNACGLYLKIHKIQRPQLLRQRQLESTATRNAPETPVETPECTNCGTRVTPLWRKDEAGAPLCNACGLYLKLHKRHRPTRYRADVIRKRTRYDPRLRPAAAESPASSPLGTCSPINTAQWTLQASHEPLQDSASLACCGSSDSCTGPVLTEEPAGAFEGVPSGIMMPHADTIFTGSSEHDMHSIFGIDAGAGAGGHTMSMSLLDHSESSRDSPLWYNHALHDVMMQPLAHDSAHSV